MPSLALRLALVCLLACATAPARAQGMGGADPRPTDLAPYGNPAALVPPPTPAKQPTVICLTLGAFLTLASLMGAIAPKAPPENY